MADVTLVHPVTGATKTVSSQKATHLRGNGWLDTAAPTRRHKGKPDVPDIEAGKRRLDEEAGRVPADPVKTKDDKPTEAAEPGDPSA